jgi:hypothetical protein
MPQNAFDDELRRAFDGLSDRLRSDLTDQLNAIIEQVAKAAEAERASAVADAATQARAEAAGQVDEARAEAERQIAATLRELGAAEAQAREQGRAEALQQLHAHGQREDAGLAARLIDAMQVIDSARSLTEILDTLVSCAAREVPRAAVLLVGEAAVRGWRFVGFDPSFDAAARIELAGDAPGVIGDAIRARAPAAGRGPAAAPAFAALAEGREAVAVPLLLVGKPVAVLYADEGAEGPDRPGWKPALEALARHAARALEAVTAFRTAQAITANRTLGRAGALAAAGRDAAPSEDDQAARRYARLLVSEIKLYHEPAVIEGRRARDLMTRLGGEIARARVLYEQRIASSLPGATSHFQEELVRTLADGDPTLL